MARVASPIVTWELPKDLPAGVSVAQASRTVGKRPAREKSETDEAYDARCAASPDYQKGAVVQVLRVASNGEGVKNAIALLSKVGEGEDYGIRFAAAALNAALQNHVPLLTPATVGQSLSICPPISEPRYVDPFEAATARIGNFAREHGRMPNAKELGEIYAGLTA